MCKNTFISLRMCSIQNKENHNQHKHFVINNNVRFHFRCFFIKYLTQPTVTNTNIRMTKINYCQYNHYYCKLFVNKVLLVQVKIYYTKFFIVIDNVYLYYEL